MQPIVTPEQMRAVDASAPEPVEELIERAGRALARRARALLGGVYGRRVVAIAGTGNNGADARVAVEHLRRLGVVCHVIEPSARVLPPCDLVIDGAFGTGLSRPFQAPAVPPDATVLAVDIPSGVDGLTGEVHGSAVAADETVTFAALKPGLVLGSGASLSGRVVVADIGLDVGAVDTWLFERNDAVRLLPERPVDAHKWRSAVWVIGGSGGMHGAPSLASSAAMRAGAGLVRMSVPGASEEVGHRVEVVGFALGADDWADHLQHELSRFGALVVGPGIGRTPSAEMQVGRMVALRAPQDAPVAVLDGDALRLLGERPRLDDRIVLTPHDGEYTSLMGRAPNADRFGAASDLAATTGAVVLLKGPTTVVATPDGRSTAITVGDARLATAGSGDVLAGLIAAFAAQGLEAAEAAQLGAWVHGSAGSLGARHGLLAGDLPDRVPVVLDALTELAATPQ